MGKLTFNKYATSRVLLGLVFVGAGIFSLTTGEISLSGMTYNLFELTNIVGLTLIVFGIFVVIRGFAKY
ncbi:MAG: hypothetical protein ACI9N9_002965 [Enterobacterales bacterium]|jgi:hypothetical protein